MSAAFGIWIRSNATACDAEVAHMRERLAHRGSCRMSSWQEGRLGLGVCTLGHEGGSSDGVPQVESDGLVIAADARIDNRDWLAQQLPAFERKPSDAEIILEAYRKWGEGCPAQLLGDFAFAIWDVRKRVLFCARDQLGVKPFYYHVSDGLFAFAPEIKGLLAIPAVSRELDAFRIADFLTTNFDNRTATSFRSISRLPGGHWLRVAERQLEVTSYWQPDPEREIRYPFDAEYAEAFRETFDNAVRCRMGDGQGVGAFLSGGLDSSSVACVARNILAEGRDTRLPTFSSIFKGVPQTDESAYIDTVLRQGGFDPFFFAGDEASPCDAPEVVLAALDEPNPAANLFLNWGMFAQAREQGVRVMLDGFDGDTTVSHGSGRMMELARSWRLISLAQGATGISRLHGQSAGNWFWGSLWHHGLPRGLTRRTARLYNGLARRLGKSQAQADPWHRPLRTDFMERIGYRDYRRSMTSTRPEPTNEREAHHKLLSWGVMSDTMELLDVVGAAFGIESRYPFWDRRLVEMCLAFPSDQKLRGRWTRWVLRRALDGVLPPEIQWRPDKSNQGPNFNRAMAAEISKLEAEIKQASGVLGEYVDLPVVLGACERFPTDPRDADALMLFKVTMLARWLRR